MAPNCISGSRKRDLNYSLLNSRFWGAAGSMENKNLGGLLGEPMEGSIIGHTTESPLVGQRVGGYIYIYTYIYIYIYIDICM